jgi:hypothetical protein
VIADATHIAIYSMLTSPAKTRTGYIRTAVRRIPARDLQGLGPLGVSLLYPEAHVRHAVALKEMLGHATICQTMDTFSPVMPGMSDVAAPTITSILASDLCQYQYSCSEVLGVPGGRLRRRTSLRID